MDLYRSFVQMIFTDFSEFIEFTLNFFSQNGIRTCKLLRQRCEYRDRKTQITENSLNSVLFHLGKSPFGNLVLIFTNFVTGSGGSVPNRCKPSPTHKKPHKNLTVGQPMTVTGHNGQLHLALTKYFRLCTVQCKGEK